MQLSMNARDAAGDARTSVIENQLATLSLQNALQPAALQPAALQPALQPAALQPAALQLAAARSSSAAALHSTGAPAHTYAPKLSAYNNTGSCASDDENFCDDLGWHRCERSRDA
jgi:hypothetical protein